MGGTVWSHCWSQKRTDEAVKKIKKGISAAETKIQHHSREMEREKENGIRAKEAGNTTAMKEAMRLYKKAQGEKLSHEIHVSALRDSLEQIDRVDRMVEMGDVMDEATGAMKSKAGVANTKVTGAIKSTRRATDNMTQFNDILGGAEADLKDVLRDHAEDRKAEATASADEAALSDEQETEEMNRLFSSDTLSEQTSPIKGLRPKAGGGSKPLGVFSIVDDTVELDLEQQPLHEPETPRTSAVVRNQTSSLTIGKGKPADTRILLD